MIANDFSRFMVADNFSEFVQAAQRYYNPYPANRGKSEPKTVEQESPNRHAKMAKVLAEIKKQEQAQQQACWQHESAQ